MQMVCINVSTEIQKIVVWVVSSWHVSIITCYESKIWLLALYENSCYHLNKNGCFSCSEHRYFFSQAGKNSVVSAVFAPSRDFLILKHVLKTGEIEWIEYGWLVSKQASKQGSRYLYVHVYPHGHICHIWRRKIKRPVFRKLSVMNLWKKK